MPREIYIMGAGGVGREIAAVLRYTSLKDEFSVIGFIDDGQPKGAVVNGIEVKGGIDDLLRMQGKITVVIAIGNPEIRRKIIDRLSNSNIDFPTILHPNVALHDLETIKIGKGVYISDGCILTTDISIGDFCFLNLAVTLNHDAVIQENCVLMPGVRLTCGVTIGADSYVSANCALTKPDVFPQKSRITTSI